MEYRKLSKLKLNEKNPRGIKKADYERLKEQIQRLGQYKPVLITPEGRVLGGNMRVRAYTELGIEDVWVSIVKPKNKTEEMEYILSDNDSAGYWEEQDLAELIQQLPQLKLETYKIDVGKFKSLDDLMSEYAPDEIIEDEVPELPEKAESKLGEVYELGRHRLMCGDSTKIEDVEKLMNGQKADMVFTDPPYGIDADKMTMGSGAKEFHRGEWDKDRIDISFILGLADKVCIWGGNYYTDILPMTNDWLCWHKKNDNLSFSEFELAWTNFGKNCRHISHHWGSEKKQHVTMKPVSVMAWGIDLVEGNNVLDLFGGSGSTLIACEQLDRTCYMMELDPKYCDVIRKRYEQFKED